MKKTYSIFLFVFALAVPAKQTIAQTTKNKGNDFEGTISYAISFEGSGLPQEALTMLNGAELTTYIKGDKRRTDMNMAIQSTTSFTDVKAKSVITIMDIMGQKYLIRMNESDIQKEEQKAPDLTIKYLDDTKDIAGYKCKKAEVTLKSKEGKEDVVTVYYTDQIPASQIKAAYKGLKGFPMEYSLFQGGIKMTFSAKSVSTDPVADTKFDIPKEGYTETTMENFQKMVKSMGGQ